MMKRRGWGWLLLVAALDLFGCTGDCMTCHPALLKTIDTDRRHQPMTTCIKCHAADPQKMAECGSDCFACHPVAKIEGVHVEEHKVIRECRECHMKLKSSLKIDAAPSQSVSPTLREFLQQ